jgi:hypothetical protein
MLDFAMMIAPAVRSFFARVESSGGSHPASVI